jgi:hypothetical protein
VVKLVLNWEGLCQILNGFHPCIDILNQNVPKMYFQKNHHFTFFFNIQQCGRKAPVRLTWDNVKDFQFSAQVIGVLFVYLLLCVPLKNFSLVWRRHHYRWRASKYRPTLALRAFEQGGIFIVPHLPWHGTFVFLVSFEGPPQSVGFYDTQGNVANIILPGSSRVPIHSFICDESYIIFALYDEDFYISTWLQIEFVNVKIPITCFPPS